MSVPATLQNFRPEKDLSFLGVPNRMATVGFCWVEGHAIFTKPNAKRVQTRLKCRNVLAVIGCKRAT